MLCIVETGAATDKSTGNRGRSEFFGCDHPGETSHLLAYFPLLPSRHSAALFFLGAGIFQRRPIPACDADVMVAR